ncbi:MAG: phosphate ABC transporter, permease protein PstA, partial [Gammaproteobacteria bacterium]|nr:phosphate ABC transporter, permease protein PstA [Gammaproteobacteria bacterium]
MNASVKKWYASGDPYVWLNAGAVSVCIIMVAGLLALIAVRGLGHFWPATVYEFAYSGADGEPARLIGEIVDRELVPGSKPGANTKAGDEEIAERFLIKTGNRDFVGL